MMNTTLAIVTNTELMGTYDLLSLMVQNFENAQGLLTNGGMLFEDLLRILLRGSSDQQIRRHKINCV